MGKGVKGSTGEMAAQRHKCIYAQGNNQSTRPMKNGAQAPFKTAQDSTPSRRCAHASARGAVAPFHPSSSWRSTKGKMPPAW